MPLGTLRSSAPALAVVQRDAVARRLDATLAIEPLDGRATRAEADAAETHPSGV
jgi:hypothetical protein